MNFKQLKPETLAAFRAAQSKLRGMARDSSPGATALAAKTPRTSPPPRIGGIGRSRDLRR